MFGKKSPIIYVIYLISINLFGLLLNYFAYSDLLLCYACKEMDTIDKHYDYIIVGSGSAGSIVAQRLSQDRNLKILLLEAGSYGSRILDAPAMGVMLQKTIFDWQYQTVPQKQACLAYENNMCNWPMGRIVGGTSRLNNMIYMHGHRQDFSNWYQNQFHYNYDYDILPYFKKLENSQITIGDIPFLSDLSNAILSAAENFGFPIINNNNLDCDFGFSIPKITIKNGRRDTPSHRLFETNQKNLQIRYFTHVTKLLLHDNYEVTGVEYIYLNDNYRASASKGVILSAGVIGTPKILMLSGIGNDKHLKSIKIPTIINLPVGDNLQDHVTTGFDLFLLNQTLNMDFLQMLSPSSIYDYYIKSTGHWTTIGCENVAFLTTTNTTKIPNLELMVLPMGVTSDNGLHLHKLIGLKSNIWLKYFDKINDTAITILPIVTHPKSRGVVRLKDKNPLTPPLIDPRYFSHLSDIETIIDGIYLIQKLIEMPALQRFGVKLNQLQFPGCENCKFNTRPYWECYIRHLTVTSYHPIGTCAIGKVVDYDFKVYQTNRLYIVDGSILPNLPTGNPNGAIMMLAMKAVDIIKSHQYLNRKTCKLIDIFIPKLIC